MALSSKKATKYPSLHSMDIFAARSNNGTRKMSVYTAEIKYDFEMWLIPYKREAYTEYDIENAISS